MGERTSKVFLAKGIKVDRNYKNTLDYSEEIMLTYVIQNRVLEMNSCSFIKNTNTLKLSASYGDCLMANYMAFQNPFYSNKWFFAWIDEVRYLSDNAVEIDYTVDEWSTWYRDTTKKESFVVREHTNDDTIGKNTIPENLNVEEYVQEYEFSDTAYNSTYIVISTTYNPANEKDMKYITKYNRQLYGSELFLFREDMIVDVGLFIAATNAAGKSAAIQSIFFAPDAAIEPKFFVEHTGTYGGQTYSFWGLKVNDNIATFTSAIDKQHSFSDYTPKNNKCFCYPYNYLYVTNNNGNDNIYKYEDFSTVNCVFVNQLVISQGASGQLLPTNYKRILANYDESIPLAKYPICSWVTDSYTAWLTSQAVNIPSQIVLGGASTTANAKANGTPTGTALSVASQVSGLIGQFYDASLMPNVSHGGNTADCNFTADNLGFKFRRLRAKTEYLKIIDDYFTRFGYKVNLVKVPNTHVRKYFDYVEIGSEDIVCYGNIPEKSLDKINQAFRNGVTIWHDQEKIGNYSVDNPII